MDLTRLEINRRTALLTSAAIAANVINPMRAFAQATPRKGGVFNVHYGRQPAQSEHQASTGVIIGGKSRRIVDLDANGQTVGVLAESCSHARRQTVPSNCAGRHWHDGKPFTPAEVDSPR
jgi:peptide/nickel transport system substrate-binding protein